MQKWFFLVTFLFFLPHHAFGQVFPRNLFLGSTGEDVRSLQVILNRDTRTQIAVVGGGSPGNETNFFGERTMQAVKRFQNLYKTEVLVPAGVTAPTGVAGLQTRKKLESLWHEKNGFEEETLNVSQQISETNASSQASVSDLLQSFFSLPIKVFSASPLSVKAGDVIKVYGQGFSLNNNTVLFGNAVRVEGISSRDSAYLEITVPSNLKEGVYDLGVSQKTGTAWLSSQGASISVVMDPVKLVSVNYINRIPTLKYGTSSDVVQFSTSLAKESPKVITTIGEVPGFVDEKGILTIRLSDAPGWKDLTFPYYIETNRVLPVYVYIRNAAGYSEPVAVLVQFTK